MQRSAAACWALMLLAAAFCDAVAGKGGRGGARGAARGGARGAARSRVKSPVPRYGSALRVAGAAAAGAAAGMAAGAAMRQARPTSELEAGDGVEYREGNRTATSSAWTSAAPARDPPGWAMSWLWPLAAILRR